MSAETRASIIVLLILLVAGVGLFVGYRYESNSNRADAAESLAKQRLKTINDMTVRQRDVAALDAKYTGALADANATIESLRGDVTAGRKRLRVNATCKSNSTGASSVGYGESPGLTADAELNYYRLRSGIARLTSQVNYLQDYIRQQCLK